MLVLSRKQDEEIIIGEGQDRICVKIVKIDGGKVRLGFEAGQHIPIVRSELVAKKHNNDFVSLEEK